MAVFDNIEIGKRLSEFRETINPVVSTYAEDLGIDYSNYAKMEKGQKPIPDSYVQAIIDKHGISPAWLYFGEGPMYKKDQIPNSARELSFSNVKNTQALSALSLIKQAAVQLEAVLSKQGFSESDIADSNQQIGEFLKAGKLIGEHK